MTDAVLATATLDAQLMSDVVAALRLCIFVDIPVSTPRFIYNCDRTCRNEYVRHTSSGH